MNQELHEKSRIMNGNDVPGNAGNPADRAEENSLLQSVVVNKFEDSYFNSNPQGLKMTPA